MQGKCIINVEECNGTPGFVLDAGKNNKGIEVEPNTLSAGLHNFTFQFDPDSKIKFYITGKDHSSDTDVDAQGNIIADKHITIEHLILENLVFNTAELHANNFDPYLGINEEEKYFNVKPFERWPWWYLETYEKVNNIYVNFIRKKPKQK